MIFPYIIALSPQKSEMSSKSRNSNYQTGTAKHRLPSVYDDTAKKQRRMRQARQASQASQEARENPFYIPAPPLPDLPEYRMTYVVPPTPGWGFEPAPLPADDPDQFLGTGQDDRMDVDEPEILSFEDSF